MDSNKFYAFASFASFVVGSNCLALLMRVKQHFQAQCLAYVGRVEHLIVYPVKSCTGIETQEADFAVTGLALPFLHSVKDRHFAVVFESENDSSCHQVLTQRQCPRMALIKLAVIEGPTDDDGRTVITDDERMTLTLRLSAPDMPNLEISIPFVHQAVSGTNRIIEACLWDEAIFGYDCGPNAAAWLRIFLGRSDVFLMHSDSDGHLKSVIAQDKWPITVADRICGNDYKTAYADWAPALLINAASIDNLNCRMKTLANDIAEEYIPVSYKNFRPNILIRTAIPFDEDNYDRIYIGPASLAENISKDLKKYWLSGEQCQQIASDASVILRNVKPCTRCILTTVDPVMGERRSDGQPLKTLRSFRLDSAYGRSPLFGINVAIDRAGHLKPGDAVFVSYMANQVRN